MNPQSNIIRQHVSQSEASETSTPHAEAVRGSADFPSARGDSASRAGSMRTAWERFFLKPVPNLALRIAVMFLGLVCIALGIAMAKHAGIGTSPISSLPAVLTEVGVLYHIPLTMGMWTFVFNLAYFLLEVALLRSRFAPVQLLQIPLFFVLSVSVDGWLMLLQGFPPAGYAQQMGFLLASIVVLGFGIRVQLASNLLMTPGDAAVQVISYVSRRRFSSCKVAWDVTLMCLAALTSLVFLGGLFQVREGTILSAVFVGMAVRAFSSVLRPLAWLVPESRKTLVSPLCPEAPLSLGGADADPAADRAMPFDAELERHGA